MLKKFLGDSALLWASQMAGIAVSVVMTIFVTRELGPEARGVYTWLLTLAGLGSHVAIFGLDTANRRLVAEEGVLAALLRMNLVVIAGLGVLVGLVCVVISLNVEMVHGRLDLVLLAMATLPMSAWMMASSSLLLATHSAKASAIANFVPKLVLAVGYAVLLGLHWVTVESALVFNVVASGVACLMPFIWLHPQVRRPLHMPLKRYVGAVWAVCMGSYVAGLSYYAMQKLDVVLVGYFLGDKATGFYGVASNLADLMILPIGIIAALLATRIAAGTSSGLTKHVVAITMGLAVAGSAFTWLIADWLIVLLFGEEFRPAAHLLKLLCPAVVGLSFFMLMHNMLLATGRVRYVVIPATVGMVVNVVLNVLLLPMVGVEGACFASMAAYPVAGSVAWLIVRTGVRRA